MGSGSAGRWWRRALRAGLGLAGIVAIALIGFAAMFSSGADDVESFCREATPGLPFVQLAALARRHDVRLVSAPDNDSGAHSLLAHSPRSYGRHTCRVWHDNNAVVESRHGFAD